MKRRSTKSNLVAVAALATTAGMTLLAGCGQQTASQVAPAVAVATQNPAASGNSGCVQATPVVAGALGVLTRFQHATVSAAGAQQPLAAAQARLGALARSTSDDVLQEKLTEAYDAFAAFRAVMMNPGAPAYPDTLANLVGQLSGFQRTCSVGNPDFETGTQGWAPATGNSALSRSSTAESGNWSLEVTNTGKSADTTGFTDSPSWVGTTLPGSEQVGLWARSLKGQPTITVQVRELSGGTVVGSQQVTVRLSSTFFGFADVTYQVRHPGSRLSVTVTAENLAPGDGFLVDDVTMVRH